MLKVITRTILVLLVAGLVSGGLYAFAKSNIGHAWLGFGAANPPAVTAGSQGSGSATFNSSSSSQSSSDYQPNTLMDVLQKLQIVLEFTAGVIILQMILSLFIKKKRAA